MRKINRSRDADPLNETESLVKKAAKDMREKEHNFPVKIDLIGPEWGARRQHVARVRQN